MNVNENSYLNEIINALELLGGVGSLTEINNIIEKNNTMPYIHTNNNWRRNVSATIQRHCKSTKSYQGAENIFYSVFGLREGYWGLEKYYKLTSLVEINPIEQRQIDIIKSNVALSKTEKETIILSRRGQGVFREKLINKYHSCIITGITDERMLIASHIKPWRNADNYERLSSENGILLSPLYDRLFDIGLITFKTNGNIVISSELSVENKNKLYINEKHSYLLISSEELKKNIEYHNDVVFKG